MFIRKIPVTIFSVLLISSLATGTASAKSNETINYVALGDSLAEGQMPTELGLGYYNVDKGYASIIKDRLAEEDVLGSYDNFGESGNTIEKVLISFIYNPDFEQIAAIQKADVITLDIGANDLLNRVNMDDAGLSRLTKLQLAGMIDQMPKENINLLLQSIWGYIDDATGGVADTILAIRAIEDRDGEGQPYAQIYVMGYYNAFSFLTDLDVDDPEKISLLQDGLAALIQDYNVSLQAQLSSMEGVTYVDTYDSMDKHLEKYLPIDIHPTVQGYRAIAKAFWDAMKPVLVSE